MLWILLFTPLVGSALCGLLHFRKLRTAGHGAHDGHGHDDHGHAGPSPAGLIACTAMAIALGLSITAFAQLAGAHGELAL